MYRRAAVSGTTNAASAAEIPLADSAAPAPRPRRVKKRRAKLSYANEDRMLFIIICTGVSMLGCLVAFLGYKVMMSGYSAPTHKIHLNPSNYANDHNNVPLEDALPWNSIYRVPEAMEIVGDRSDRYARLRQEIDPLLPDDPDRSHARVRELTARSYATLPMDVHHSDQVAYDIYDCPEQPPAGYPYAWKLLDVLKNWPPDDPTPRPHIYQGLCVFDYTRDYDKAMTYRMAEVPFIVVGDPSVHKTVERWNVPGYMESMLGTEPHRCEYSANNHFMYYTPVSKKRRNAKQVPEGWKEPTKLMRMPYAEWLAHANVTDEHLGPDQPHWYYRLIGCGLMGHDGSCDRGASEYLYDELPFFQPKKSLYIDDAAEQKGIHCRFGMKGEY